MPKKQQTVEELEKAEEYIVFLVPGWRVSLLTSINSPFSLIQ